MALAAGGRLGTGQRLADQGHDVEIRVSNTNSDPWDFILTPGGR